MSIEIDPARFSEAVQFAAEAHKHQTRKRASDDLRPRIPYLSHLLGVAGLVIEDGGDSTEAIAGLLHDYLEDIRWDGEGELTDRFGLEVAAIVKACTGFKKEHIPDFRQRKQRYLDRLHADRSNAAIRVSLADKVHNARSTVNDLESDGPRMWARFNSNVEDQLWWYTALAEAYGLHALAGRADNARATELQRLVLRMHELSGA
jgi:(p)ppGpp synthase/HD superfamily hydrolase